MKRFFSPPQPTQPVAPYLSNFMTRNYFHWHCCILKMLPLAHTDVSEVFTSAIERSWWIRVFKIVNVVIHHRVWKRLVELNSSTDTCTIWEWRSDSNVKTHIHNWPHWHTFCAIRSQLVSANTGVKVTCVLKITQTIFRGDLGSIRPHQICIVKGNSS